MSEGNAAPAPPVALIPLGGSGAEFCDGDSCAYPGGDPAAAATGIRATNPDGGDGLGE